MRRLMLLSIGLTASSLIATAFGQTGYAPSPPPVRQKAAAEKDPILRAVRRARLTAIDANGLRKEQNDAIADDPATPPPGPPRVFGNPQMLDPNVAAKANLANVNLPPPVPVAPRLRLAGTVLGTDSGPLAVVIDSTGAEHYARVGDEVAGARITKIERGTCRLRFGKEPIVLGL